MLQHDHDALDVGAKEVGARLVGVGDELEGEEHGGTEGVERAPVEMTRDGEGAVGEEIGTGLGDEECESVSGIDGSLEGLLATRVVDGITGGGLPRAGIRTVEGEAHVVEKDAETEALCTGATNGEDI